MTLIFYVIIGLITFVAFLHARAKKEYEISRTVIINRPKAEVYAFIKQLNNQSHWMPWYVEDPNTIQKFKGEDGQVGASMYWKASKIEGIQRIVKIKEGKVFETQVFYIRPYKSSSLSYIAVKELDSERTKLVWGAKGIHKFPVSVITMIYGINRVFGQKFEQGLYNLRKHLEKEQF